MFTGRKRRSIFVAEEVTPDKTRRALLGAICACCTVALVKPGDALAAAGPAPAPGPSRAIHTTLDDAAREIEQKMIDWRRDIHQHPELGNRETRTAGLVAEHLKSLGYEVQEGVAVTGVVGVLKGEAGDGPTLAIRADMDALPVTEQVDLPFASKAQAEWGGDTVGVMHACGHDCHVAILMAVAEVLAKHRSELKGTFMLIFQPAEEGLPEGEIGGARLMVESGIFKTTTPDAVVGLHVGSGHPVGVVAFKAGPATSGSDTFRITVQGKQTHGAMPWNGVDPVVIGSAIVSTLQTLTSRESDVFRNPAIVTVGTFDGGVRHNIVPDRVELTGTLRTFSEEHRQQMRKRVGEVASGIATSMRGSAEVTWSEAAYPTVVNNETLTEQLAPSIARAAAGGKVIVNEFPGTASEDFSFFANEVPGFFFSVGTGNPDEKDRAPNHSPRFKVDEAGLIYGLRSMLHIAADFTSSGA